MESPLGTICVERKRTVKQIMAFKLSIDYVARGLSFRHAANILTHTAMRTGLHMYRGVRKEDVARFVRAIVGINLDKISSLLRSNEAWALNGATVEGQPFLDVRVRLCVRGEVENILLVAIPLQYSHTGLEMARMVEKTMLEVGGECCRENLIGIVATRKPRIGSRAPKRLGDCITVSGRTTHGGVPVPSQEGTRA
jgi:hypothetical protein